MTLPLVGSKLLPEEQGIYYSFVYLAQASVFLELGFCQTFVQYSAREFAGLRFSSDDRLEGDPKNLSRVAGLARFGLRWFAGGTVVYALVLAVGGSLFFARTAPAELVWTAPWLVFLLISSLNLIWLPLWATMEGCQRVLEVTRVRLKAGVLALVLMWIALWFGGGLWAQAAFQAGIFVVSAFYWLKIRRGFLTQLLEIQGAPAGAWFRELLPFQWRIAVSFGCGFLLFSMMVPMAQAVLGPVSAGRIGMTLQGANAIMAVATAWIQTRAPALGVLAAQSRIGELRGMLGGAIRSALFVAVAGAVCFLLSLVAVNQWTSFGSRFLGYAGTLLLLLAGVVNVVIGGLAVGLRAQIQEPFMPLSVGLAGTVLGATFFGGSLAGEVGFVGGYAAAMVVVGLPVAVLIFRRRIGRQPTANSNRSH